jgi:hypothetical protein
MPLPPFGKMLLESSGKSKVIENHPRAGALRFQFKSRDGIRTFWPRRGSPRLHDPLIGNQFHVAPRNLPPEKGKHSARLTVDLARNAGERRELLRIQQRLVHLVRACMQFHNFMNRSRFLRLRDPEKSHQAQHQLPSCHASDYNMSRKYDQEHIILAICLIPPVIAKKFAKRLC